MAKETILLDKYAQEKYNDDTSVPCERNNLIYVKTCGGKNSQAQGTLVKIVLSFKSTRNKQMHVAYKNTINKANISFIKKLVNKSVIHLKTSKLACQPCYFDFGPTVVTPAT